MKYPEKHSKIIKDLFDNHTKDEILNLILNKTEVKILKGEEEPPYLESFQLHFDLERSFNPAFDEDKICKCGHSYDRHFDSYENNLPAGCKYCECGDFKEETSAEPNIQISLDL